MPFALTAYLPRKPAGKVIDDLITACPTLVQMVTVQQSNHAHSTLKLVKIQDFGKSAPTHAESRDKVKLLAYNRLNNLAFFFRLFRSG